MSKQTKQQAILQHLRSLEHQPGEQARYALDILDQERSEQVIPEALKALKHASITEARPILRKLYDYYADFGVKLDSGGSRRIAILEVLLPNADVQDQKLAERAIATYEFLPPGHDECAGGLRATGLILLSNIDPILASYHCTHLLVDAHTSPMSGEPAVSAARLLADLASHLPYQGHLLPLYSYLFAQHVCQPEVEAECLRQLAKAPPSIIDTVIAHYFASLSLDTGIPQPRYETKDDIVLLGLFDLLLAYPKNSMSFIEHFLRETQRDDVYQYVLTTIIASHTPQLWKLLLEVARDEQNPEKVEILLAALALLQNEPEVEMLIHTLQQCKANMKKRGRTNARWSISYNE